MEENEEWLSAGFTVKKLQSGFISYHLLPNFYSQVKLLDIKALFTP